MIRAFFARAIDFAVDGSYLSLCGSADEKYCNTMTYP